MSRAITAITAVGVAAVLLLSGCSMLPKIPVFNDGGDSSSDNGGTSAEDIEANPFLDNEVPADFPAEVPLPDLDIYLALAPTADSWSIIFMADDLASDYSSIVSDFESAGWETVMNNEAPDGSLGVFQKDPYHVQVTGVADGGTDFEGPAISFTVARTS